MKIIPKNFEIPEGLSPEGEKAWELVTTFFVENKMTDTGGCKTFYSPKEWQEKGNRYGTKSVLIVVYDGEMFPRSATSTRRTMTSMNISASS